MISTYNFSINPTFLTVFSRFFPKFFSLLKNIQSHFWLQCPFRQRKGLLSECPPELLAWSLERHSRINGAADRAQRPVSPSAARVSTNLFKAINWIASNGLSSINLRPMPLVHEWLAGQSTPDCRFRATSPVCLSPSPSIDQLFTHSWLPSFSCWKSAQ